MNQPGSKAAAEADLVICQAANMPGRIVGSFIDGEITCDVWLTGHNRVVKFHPTTDIRDALYAAVEAGILENGWTLSCSPDAPPALKYDFRPSQPRNEPYEPLKGHCSGPTAPLAVCEAIKVNHEHIPPPPA